MSQISNDFLEDACKELSKDIKEASLNVSKLTTDEKGLLTSAINRSGNSGHPVASAQTIGYFTKEYAIACLNKAKTNLTPEGIKVADSIISKISGKVSKELDEKKEETDDEKEEKEEKEDEIEETNSGTGIKPLRMTDEEAEQAKKEKEGLITVTASEEKEEKKEEIDETNDDVEKKEDEIKSLEPMEQFHKIYNWIKNGLSFESFKKLIDVVAPVGVTETKKDEKTDVEDATETLEKEKE